MTTSPHRSLTVVGAGYVGLVTAVGLARLGHDVHLVETAPARLEMLRAGRIPIHEAGLQEGFDAAVADGRLTVGDAMPARSGIILICVGTPIGDDGTSDLRQLDAAMAALQGRIGSDDILVIRSTLPVGGTRPTIEAAGSSTARVFTNPEFLRQGTAVDDFAHPSRIVVGRFPDADPDALAAVLALYDGIEAPRLVVDVEAAEIIKNGANAFLALKLSFTNEIASLCEEAGADVAEVLAGIGADPRIGRTYMHPSFGFGGSCLPKELTTLAVAGRAFGLPMHVTTAASDANMAAQDRFAERVLAAVGGPDGRTIGLLGLAFKAGTDDIRDSPATRLAERLLGAGARVRAYDPAAGPNAQRRIPALQLVDDPGTVFDGADAIVIATEWPEFRDLPWADWADRPTRRLVIDGRRLLDAGAVRAAGYDVVQLGDGRLLPGSPTPGVASRRG
ncbi:MAG TPA: UDP-glucose/GDP-mannose dehydrogenase family protein [Candidatus Limnocylindrales bacterium]|jgi:UDPglucose 6-dehydrogenase|nr:UDP-glucose/GDP-mannose dehydrogenase family protein [Candidatus Limnocylindrales bacterium]